MRLVLAAVFGMAAFAKFADPAGSRRAMSGFGVPGPVTGATAVLLPAAELLVAALLLPQATAWSGACGALALLLLFVAGIAANLAQGRQPDCYCFGRIHSEPAGPRVLVRNLLLAGLAASIVVRGAHAPSGILRTLTQGVAVLDSPWLSGLEAIVALTIAWTFLPERPSRAGSSPREPLAAGSVPLADAPEAGTPRIGRSSSGDAPPSWGGGLDVGTRAPRFALRTLSGATHTLDRLREPGKGLLLVFLDPSCGSCAALSPDIAAWERRLAASHVVAVISRGTPGENEATLRDLRLRHVLLQNDRETIAAYQMLGTPSAVFIDDTGCIATPAAYGDDTIRTLVASQLPAAIPAPPPPGHESTV